MKKKFSWILLSFLLVAALVLASCGPTVPGEQEEEEEEEEPVGEQEEEEEEEEEEEPVVGAPQYGGTLTFLTERARSKAPVSWDPLVSNVFYLLPYAENLLLGDVEKYGPRGTNEFAFEITREEVPEKFLKPTLCESWEYTTDPLGVRFHIRPGVYWTGESVNPGVMERRELTAYDVEFWGNRYRDSVLGPGKLMAVAEGGFKALDRYTLQVTFTKMNVTMLYMFAYAYQCCLYPPEVVEAGITDWKNHVGTGPFILEEYVEGSYIKYRKNSNWWDKERIIDGKKYDVPFIDELVLPVIPDESTRIAALRTGKADLAQGINLSYKDSLFSTSPDLVRKEYPEGVCLVVVWKSDTGIAADRNIRQAIMIGTDLEAVVKTILTEGDVGTYPFNKSLTGAYIPLEELPAETKLLFEYNPELAKQMIIDAGHPDGIQIPVYYAADDVDYTETAALLADMWDKIGVEVLLKPTDPVVYARFNPVGGFEGCHLHFQGNSRVTRGLDFSRTQTYCALYHDEWYNEQCDKLVGEMDEAKRASQVEQIYLYAINEANVLPIGTPYSLSYWWPWVKNYYGEIDAGRYNIVPMASLLWIDQALKAEMGY